ncbi:four helix bundle protein [Candidatus Nomurabacteria bacterium]|nr:four helix bundle protein [Candidatus Nomurabacteria bacterium]
MTQFHSYNTTPPPLSILPVLTELKTVYILWIDYYQKLPKIHKYTLGQKIDTLFIESIEAISIASFLSKEEKLPYVRLGIRKIDTIKILFMILWEIKCLDNKKYIVISEKMNTVGKMLGGWSGQIIKQNSLGKA